MARTSLTRAVTTVAASAGNGDMWEGAGTGSAARAQGRVFDGKIRMLWTKPQDKSGSRYIHS